MLPDGLGGQRLASTELLVVAPKGRFAQQAGKLAGYAPTGWILNPEGCGFRAALQRGLADRSGQACPAFIARQISTCADGRLRPAPAPAHTRPAHLLPRLPMDLQLTRRRVVAVTADTQNKRDVDAPADEPGPRGIQVVAGHIVEASQIATRVRLLASKHGTALNGSALQAGGNPGVMHSCRRLFV